MYPPIDFLLLAICLIYRKKVQIVALAKVNLVGSARDYSTPWSVLIIFFCLVRNNDYF